MVLLNYSGARTPPKMPQYEKRCAWILRSVVYSITGRKTSRHGRKLEKEGTDDSEAIVFRYKLQICVTHISDMCDPYYSLASLMPSLVMANIASASGKHGES